MKAQKREREIQGNWIISKFMEAPSERKGNAQWKHIKLYTQQEVSEFEDNLLFVFLQFIIHDSKHLHETHEIDSTVTFFLL